MQHVYCSEARIEAFLLPFWYPSLYLLCVYLRLFQFPMLLKLITQFSDFHTDTLSTGRMLHRVACIRTHASDLHGT